MTKTSKVSNVQGTGTWTSKQYGTTFYKFEVTFENGDSGEYSSKSQEQTKFVVGQDADYTIDSTQYGSKIKPVSNFDGNSSYTPVAKNSDRELSIIRQSSLKCATDYVVANGGDESRIIDIADILTKWVQTGEKPTSTSTNDDMPF